MKLLLAALLPAALGSGVALSVPPPDPALRSALLVSSQRVPCLYARLAAERGENTRERLRTCASQWHDRQAAQWLARQAAASTEPPGHAPAVTPRTSP
ncbi:MAG: hypothetical protein ACRCTL_02380 [Pseudomonas sp.]